MNKLISNSTNYLLKPGHDQLFLETKEWKSDLEFYKTELAFLDKLLDKTFLRITTHAETIELESLTSEIRNLVDNKLEPLFRKVLSHEKYLGTMEKETFSKSEDSLWEEQGKIGGEIYSFISEVKILKQNIFKSVEEIMRIAKNASSDFMNGNVAL